jgi:hypothetical protein
MRSGTGGGRTRTQRWCGSASGWRRSGERRHHGLDLVTRQRRALEALRAGVPSRDAVGLLGSGQAEIEDRFLALVERARDGAAGGMLLGGGFGSGKSHLLQHLGQLALNAGLAVSRVVISKETPLHDPVKVFRAAADSAVVAGRHDTAIAEAAADLHLDGPAYAELLSWAGSPESDLNARFVASLLLFARLRDRDPECGGRAAQRLGLVADPRMDGVAHGCEYLRVLAHRWTLWPCESIPTWRPGWPGRTCSRA